MKLSSWGGARTRPLLQVATLVQWMVLKIVLYNPQHCSEADRADDLSYIFRHHHVVVLPGTGRRSFEEPVVQLRRAHHVEVQWGWRKSRWTNKSAGISVFLKTEDIPPPQDGRDTDRDKGSGKGKPKHKARRKDEVDDLPGLVETVQILCKATLQNTQVLRGLMNLCTATLLLPEDHRPCLAGLAAGRKYSEAENKSELGPPHVQITMMFLEALSEQPSDHQAFLKSLYSLLSESPGPAIVDDLFPYFVVAETYPTPAKPRRVKVTFSVSPLPLLPGRGDVPSGTELAMKTKTSIVSVCLQFVE